ncbi:MAG TPA: methyltransferase domain-containing protein [Pyrinomonadaceae bacterium]|nr:methyltransferase domain-containing protein [Pyrinomonadaceae bacterium]
MASVETKHETLLQDEKQRARDQWSHDPCGAEFGKDLEFGSREFFDSVEKQRYRDYAPWMPRVMGFDQFAGKRLLEVGCGMGTDLLQFARGGAICTGADLTPRSIEISRRHFEVYGFPGTFLITDGERLPFPDESFDVVYSNGVLHHTPDTAGAIHEIHRVLRPGGIAKVMLYYRHSLNYWGEMILHRGLLRGELLRGRSPEEIMSRWVEYSEKEGRPLVKVYSRTEARKLFRDFKSVDFEVDQLTRAEFYRLSAVIPDQLFQFLRKHFGWNLIITATK